MKLRQIGVLAFTTVGLLLAGCGKPAPSGLANDGTGHGHSHTAKYGGVLVEIGSHEFNLEVLVDPAAGKLTIWTLDAHAEGYVRVAAKTLDVAVKVNNGAAQDLVTKAVANPATGEVEGSTAQFEATAAWLKGAQDVDGIVKSVTLGGKTFTDLKFDWPHGADNGHKH